MKRFINFTSYLFYILIFLQLILSILPRKLLYFLCQPLIFISQTSSLLFQKCIFPFCILLHHLQLFLRDFDLLL